MPHPCVLCKGGNIDPLSLGIEILEKENQVYASHPFAHYAKEPALSVVERMGHSADIAHSLDENRVYSVLLYCLASHPIQFERRSS